VEHNVTCSVSSEDLSTLIDCACDECMRDYFVLIKKWKMKAGYLSLEEAIGRVDFHMRSRAAKRFIQTSKWEYYYFL
jgi:hypothetical protein